MRTPRERTSPKSVGTASYGLVPHGDEWYAFAKRTKRYKERFREIRAHLRLVNLSGYETSSPGLLLVLCLRERRAASRTGYEVERMLRGDPVAQSPM
jgi:hypothetical protein